MLTRLSSLFAAIENLPLTLGSWLMALMAIIGGRIALELAFDNVTYHFADEYFYQFAHHFLIFSLIYLLALPLVIWFARVGMRQAALILLFGFLVIWTPPIVDEIISRGAGFWSFYSFDSAAGLVERYYTFFGDKPDVGITYGVRFEIGLVLLLMAVYIFVRTRSWWRTLLGTLALYTMLFIVGVLPSLVTMLLLGPDKGFLAVTELDVARVMLSPEPLYILNPPDIAVVLAIKMGLVYAVLLPLVVSGILFLYARSILFALWRNPRFPQVCYHAGLFLAGAGLVWLYENGATTFANDWRHWLGLAMLLFSVVLAWVTSVIVNDLHDTRIDTLTNPDRPLIRGTIPRDLFATIGLVTFGASIFYAAYISTQLALLLALYQALAWIYSAPPLRLKRFPGVATLLAASASLLILFGGYLVFSLYKNTERLPDGITVLLFVAYLILLPIKDFKDIAGDKADGVTTLPVLWGEAKAKRIIGAAAFAVFIASVFVLDVRHLFPLAFFFGSLAYWLLQISSATHRYFRYRYLAGWYMALVSGYVAFLTWHFLTR